MLNKGEVRGVGVVADLTARTTERIELIWQGAAAIPAIQSLGCDCRTSGEVNRALVGASQLDAAIDILRRHRAHLISITPVRASLEDYFLERLSSISETHDSVASPSGRG